MITNKQPDDDKKMYFGEYLINEEADDLAASFAIVFCLLYSQLK